MKLKFMKVCTCSYCPNVPNVWLLCHEITLYLYHTGRAHDADLVLLLLLLNRQASLAERMRKKTVHVYTTLRLQNCHAT